MCNRGGSSIDICNEVGRYGDMAHALLIFQTKLFFLAIRGKVELQICFLYVSLL